MRWTGWVLATAVIAGCAGQASGGQPGCVGCAGGAALGQPNYASLSGEACCSPNGYSGVSAIPGCCCSQSQPCCNNAWDGYCEHMLLYLLALGARLELAHAGVTRRVVDLETFFVSAAKDIHRENELQSGEIITAVVLPATDI